jgi:ribosomal protein S18 acetylase RimI-like enzyme
MSAILLMVVTVRRVTTVRQANSSDLGALVESVGNLFRDDAGRYGTYADITWPARAGLARYAPLASDPAWLLLVALDDDQVVGHLVASVHDAPPTRLPVRAAEMESIYVRADCRGRGVGALLTDSFLHWAADQGAVEAFVTAYVANESAQRFYERHGFVSESVIRCRPLTRDD